MVGKAIALLVFVSGAALWAVGCWQIYEANTLAGALLVVAGGLVCVAVVAWWRRDPDAGFEGVVSAIAEFFSRAP